MPELPEVEVVRAGLAPAVTGAQVQSVEVRDLRSIKRHRPELGDFERLLTGATLGMPVRRGKFLWIPLQLSPQLSQNTNSLSSPSPSPSNSAAPAERGDFALLAHLGMSGQILLRDASQTDDRHVRVRLWLAHPSHSELRVDFVDQRLFGSLAVDRLIATDDGVAGGFGSEAALVPSQAAHISRDVLDPAFDDARFRQQLARRSSAIKRALLDQQLVSGIGNIYADESLWAARIHPETPSSQLSTRKVNELLAQVRAVLNRALAEGGTSFDEQYVNVNGQAGYFAHSLNAYGREGEPCPRCGTPIRRVAFMNRSSHFCHRCQRLS